MVLVVFMIGMRISRNSLPIGRGSRYTTIFRESLRDSGVVVLFSGSLVADGFRQSGLGRKQIGKIEKPKATSECALPSSATRKSKPTRLLERIRIIAFILRFITADASVHTVQRKFLKIVSKNQADPNRGTPAARTQKPFGAFGPGTADF
jgi:hypothetical protein